MKPIPKYEREAGSFDSVLPVTLATAKEFIRVDGTADDLALGVMLSAAVLRIETHIERKLITQNWNIYFDQFPCSWNEPDWEGERDGALSSLQNVKPEIELPFGPLQSVTSFKTIDEDDAEHTFDAGEYSIDTLNAFGRIKLKMGSVWPATVLKPVNGIKIAGVFGFGDAAANVPDPIKQAILMFFTKLYENRGDNNSGEFFGFSSVTLPPTAAMLLEPFRRIKVG